MMLQILYPGDETTLQRFTQDTPVLPDVWLGHAEDPPGHQSLLLTPHFDSDAPRLYAALKARLERAGRPLPRLFYNESNVLAELGFEDLVRHVLPLSRWWNDRIWGNRRAPVSQAWSTSHSLFDPAKLAGLLAESGTAKRHPRRGGAYHPHYRGHRVRAAGSGTAGAARRPGVLDRRGRGVSEPGEGLAGRNRVPAVDGEPQPHRHARRVAFLAGRQSRRGHPALRFEMQRVALGRGGQRHRRAAPGFPAARRHGQPHRKDL